MGIYDRDYMRDHHAQQTRSNLPRRNGPSSGLWSTARWIGYATIAVLTIFFLSKYMLERRAAVPFPSTGDVHWFTQEGPARIARLTLAAPATAKHHFAVRLDDWATGAPLAMIPVRGGETSVTLVPLGRYRMTIAKGTVWLGSSRLFGVGGEVREVVHPVEFFQQGRTTMGRRIDLEVPFAGNTTTRMETRPANLR